jgi:hypothetical protein
MDPEDRILVDSLDNPPVLEDIPAVPEDTPAVVETEDHNLERLWKEWTKNQQSQREETEDLQLSKTSKTKTNTKELKAKTKILENNEEPESERPRSIESLK